MLRALARSAYIASHPHGVVRHVAGLDVRLPAVIARGVPAHIDSPILAAWLEACGTAQVAVDAGANVGVWSALALAAGAEHVFAIEPSPAGAAVCRQMAALYPGRMRVIEAALGDTERMAHLAVDGTFAATNRLSDDGLIVSMRRLDALCREFHLAPDVVKMDIEGAEALALRGMAGLPRWPLTLVELHWVSRLGMTPDALLTAAEELGVSIATPDGQSLAANDSLLRHDAVLLSRENIIV